MMPSRKRPAAKQTARKGATRRKPAPKKKAAPRRRNIGETGQAGKLSEAFHGRPPRKITDVTEERRERFALAELGRLQELIVLTDDTHAARISFATRRPKLGVSPDGRQLYIVGGDQRVDLAALGIKAEERRDHCELGALHKIVYRTSKAFHDFEVTDYVHEFGEEGGKLPTLAYDTLNDSLFLIGGSYEVQPGGIVN